jgi:hypothetical protein
MAAAGPIRLAVVKAQPAKESDIAVGETGDVLIMRMLASAQVGGSPDEKSDDNLQPLASSSS